MQTFVVQLTIEVEDNINESNLSSIIVDALENSEHVKQYADNYSLSINS